MSVLLLLLILVGILALLTTPKYWFDRKRVITQGDSTVYATLYDAIYFDNEKFEREMKLLSAPEGSYVLDVGCGTGNRVGNVSNAAGVDLSPAMVAVAKKKYPTKTFVEGDVLQKELFNKETFTSIWCLGNTIYLLPKKMLFLQNVYAWLDEKGTFVLQLDEAYCTPSPYRKNFGYDLKRFGNTCRETVKFKKKKTVVETTFYPTSRDRLLTMAERVGFVLQRKAEHHFYFFRKTTL